MWVTRSIRRGVSRHLDDLAAAARNKVNHRMQARLSRGGRLQIAQPSLLDLFDLLLDHPQRATSRRSSAFKTKPLEPLDGKQVE
jgi:hypothetical protein